MFDLSIVFSFVVFVVFLIIKVLPVVRRSLDDAIEETSRSFERAQQELDDANAELTQLQATMSSLVEKHDLMLEDSFKEVQAIQRQTEATIERKTEYQGLLKEQQDIHWQGLFKEYQNTLYMHNISSAINGYARLKENEAHMQKLTEKMAKSYFSGSQTGVKLKPNSTGLV